MQHFRIGNGLTDKQFGIGSQLEAVDINLFFFPLLKINDWTLLHFLVSSARNFYCVDILNVQVIFVVLSINLISLNFLIVYSAHGVSTSQGQHKECTVDDGIKNWTETEMSTLKSCQLLNNRYKRGRLKRNKPFQFIY